MEVGDGDGDGHSDTAMEKKPSANRTLLDVIKDDPNSGYKDNNKNSSWKAFKEKLRLRSAGAAWTSLLTIPTSDIPIPMYVPDGADADANLNNRALMMRRNSSRVPAKGNNREGKFENSLHRDGSLYLGDPPQKENEEEESENENDEENEDDEEEGDGDGDGEEGEPVRMSLMALLAETDREMGLDGSTYIMDEDDDEDDEDDDEEDDEDGVERDCSVCMVRHKGTEVPPCGHTFCRMCSRELHVQRGNCPPCNGFIMEMLQVF